VAGGDRRGQRPSTAREWPSKVRVQELHGCWGDARRQKVWLVFRCGDYINYKCSLITIVMHHSMHVCEPVLISDLMAGRLAMRLA